MTLMVVACLVLAGAGMRASLAEDAPAWLNNLTSLTPSQGQTLLKLARDFFPQDELADDHYVRCIQPYDASARDPQVKAEIDESLKMVQGASRRMGYREYVEISDDYERLRLAKMLGEGRWLREFRTGVGRCLEAQSKLHRH
jgi:hypothetical protein